MVVIAEGCPCSPHSLVNLISILGVRPFDRCGSAGESIITTTNHITSITSLWSAHQPRLLPVNLYYLLELPMPLPHWGHTTAKGIFIVSAQVGVVSPHGCLLTMWTRRFRYRTVTYL